MSLDHHPIPHEALPPGWGPATVSDGRFVYRRHEPFLEVLAEQTDGDQANPRLGLGRCWKLQLRHQIGELEVTESIGHVSTKRAALEGLLECMHQIHDTVETPDDPIAVQAALDEIDLGDTVPGPK